MDFKNIKTGTEAAELPPVYVYVDGAFNAETGHFGYGCIFNVNGAKTTYMGTGYTTSTSALHPVVGDVKGARAVAKKAINMGLKEIVLFHNYAGVEHWATGNWIRNTKFLVYYHKMMSAMMREIKVTFMDAKGYISSEDAAGAAALARQAARLPNADATDANDRWVLVSVCDREILVSQHNSEKGAFCAMTEEYYSHATSDDSGEIEATTAWLNADDGDHHFDWDISRIHLPSSKSHNSEEQWILVSVCDRGISVTQHCSKDDAVRAMAEEYHEHATDDDAGEIEATTAWLNADDGDRHFDWAIERIY